MLLKVLHLLALCLLAVRLSQAAAPSDIPLVIPPLDKLEKVTPQPVKFSSREVQTLCDANTGANPSDPKSPHREVTIEVFVNPNDVECYLDPWGVVKSGGLVLKQKLKPDGTPDSYMGMRKRTAGYFPGGGDWEYFTLGANLKAVGRGRLAQCAGCHESQKERDYLFRPPLLKAGTAQLTSGRVILHSSQVVTHGEKLLYETPAHKNTLGYWVNPKDWAEWQFSLLRPGAFDVSILQGCGTGSGGSEVEMTFFPGATAGPSGIGVRFVVEDTGHFQNFKERLIGRVELPSAGTYKVELRALKKPGAAVMDLRQITLEPRGAR